MRRNKKNNKNNIVPPQLDTDAKKAYHEQCEACPGGQLFRSAHGMESMINKDCLLFVKQIHVRFVLGANNPYV